MSFFLPTLIILLCLPFIHSSNVDFIIVGAGTSGCVLASRLCTQLPHASILLLERGLPRNKSAEFKVRAPLNMGSTWTDPQLSEIIQSLPNPGLNNRSITQFTGNTLGGSSSLNAMQWTVPTASSIDRWHVKGLNSKTSRKYYQRAFHQIDPQIPSPANQQRYAPLYLSAAATAGFSQINDPFEMGTKDAAWGNILAAHNGRRRDSCTAYLNPVINTECGRNLQLVQGVTVRKILTEGKKKGSKKTRATGLEYVHSSDREQTSVKTVHARSEILLAAGPYGSPKILQLSGIGPNSLLKKMDIPTVVNLPVGERTQGRPLTFVPYKYSNLPVPPENDPAVLNNKSEIKKFEQGLPSIYNVAVPFMNGVVKGLGYFTSVFMGIFGIGVGKPIMFQGCFTNPRTFGSLRIKSKNPFDSPDLELNFMSDRREIEETASCLKRIDEITNNFVKLFVFTPLVNDTGEEFLRSSSDSAYHFVGGCTVGKVVSGELKVRGVEGLRVIDASVIPEIPVSSGPMASTYMLAEFASEKLVEEYECEYGNRRENRK